MIISKPFTMRNKKQAGLMLAEKLLHFRNSTTMVVGVPYSGALVGYHIAEKLSRPFDVIPCKTIIHPGDHRKTIGSVSPEHVVVHDEGYDIPRDYIYHQIVLGQSALRTKQIFYKSGIKHEYPLFNKNVVVVGDIIKNGDSMIAAIKTIRSMKASKIILAASLITPETFAQLSCEVDEVVSLLIQNEVQPGFYEENFILTDQDIRELMLKSCRN